MKILQIAAAFLCVCCYGFSTETPKKFIVCAGAGGAICWFVFLAAQTQGYSVTICSFLGAVFVGVYSHIMARILKTPVTVFLLGGILPLVPGLQIYQFVYAVMEQNSPGASQNLILTLKISGAIAAGVFFTDTFFGIKIGKKKRNS